MRIIRRDVRTIDRKGVPALEGERDGVVAGAP
jgi:hypothetical protein